MMSIVGNELLLSLEPKGDSSLTAEEELDHYKQRFQSMKLVLRELQHQLISYKTRCEGVDAVALLLRESKQEVIRLTKQRKCLETAVANLQNRLSSNGLSSSVNIEETEQFIPTTSKQILDNLARENARLRGILKSQDRQSESNPSEDLTNLKTSVENLEAENSNLRARVLEMEKLSLELVSRHEEAIIKLRDEYETENLHLKQQMDQQQEEQKSNLCQAEKASDMDRNSRACQTVDIEPSKVEMVRQALKLLSDHCMALDMSLQTAHFAADCHVEKVSDSTNKMEKVSEAAYQELEQKYNQVLQMNQRWQAYNHTREQQVHGLQARINELELQEQKEEGLRSIIDAKELENHNLRREIVSLTQEANKLRSQPQYDMSIVEILKQQIQVCTEDFNTERKDREQAVNRAKQLQDEINKLSNENGILRKTIDEMRRLKGTSELDKRDNQIWTKPVRKHTSPSRAGQLRIPFSPSSGTSASSLSPSPSPVPMSYSSTSSATDRSSFYPPSSQDSMNSFQGPARVGGNRQQSGYDGWKSRGPQESPPASGKGASVSMPAVSIRTERSSETKNGQTDLICPKCSKEFTEDQQSQLLSHMNSCTD